jgi:hypothetical protein
MTSHGHVRWLKAVEGGVDIPVLGARKGVAGAMRNMGAHIAGTTDAVATYVKLKPRAAYNDGTYAPGHIAGILWLSRMPAAKDVVDYAEDALYEVGWPVENRDLTCGPLLRDLVQKLYGTEFDQVWSALRGSMTGGRPFRIDVAPYERLGAALTDFYTPALRRRSAP